MKYIKIINEGTVHRRRLEILGISIKQKSEDRLETIIGQFGSGFKMAVAVALRLNLTIAIASSDEQGPYILKFKKKREVIPYYVGEEIIDIIVYSYSDTGDRDTSISLNAFPKWTSSIGETNPYYPIVRELVTNARDEDDFFTITRGDNICYADNGQTVVYIESNPKTEELILNRNRYFKFFYTEEPIFEIPGLGALYIKSSPNETRLFVQGCLAEVDLKSSLFDYDIEDSDVLSEERAIAYVTDYEGQIAEMMMRMDDSNAREVLESIIYEAHRDTDSFEASVIKCVKKDDISKNMKAVLFDIWCKFFGVKSVLVSASNQHNVEAEQLLGYKVISITSSLYKFFRDVGVLNAKELVEKEIGNIEVRDMTEKERRMVSHIIKVYLSHIKRIREQLERYPIKTTVDISGSTNGLSDYSSIQIEERVFSKADELLLTLLHELRHCTSKLHDTQYRQFLKVSERETLLLIVMLKQALEKLKEFGVDPADISDHFC